MCSFFKCSFVIFPIAIIIVLGANGVIVETPLGAINGGVEWSRGGRKFYSFYGIPYAEPPIGNLRYENPVSIKPWQGIRNATTLPPPCPSYDLNEFFGDEDCLYLNLYVPEDAYKQKTPLPTIVYIFGGKFQYCHASPSRYGPHYFMDKDVILITFHYRLGVLGFLSSEDSTLPGNYGLKDMAQLLKWVQQNIGSFNGDRNRVTVMGGSSGAAMASLAMVSPLTQGLIHRCISQSGTVYALERGLARGQLNVIANNMGCPNETSSFKGLKQCLRNVPLNDLLIDLNIDSKGPTTYGPVVEDVNVDGAFLIDELTKLSSQSTHNIPWMYGMNSNDGGMMAIFMYYGDYKNDINAAIDHFQQFVLGLLPLKPEEPVKRDPKNVANIMEKIKAKFFKGNDIRNDAQGMAKMMTTLLLVSRMKLQPSIYKGPKYMYIYDHRNEPNFDHYYGKPTEKMGVIHGDELISLFNWTEFIPPVKSGIDFVVSKQLIELWTNFASTGNPNGDQNNELWKPITESKFQYLHINNGKLETTSDFMKEEFDFFDEILEELNDSVIKNERSEL